MRTVRPAGPVFFPLDDELGLLPGDLTPSLLESLVRLGTWLPFRPTAWMLAHFTRVRVGTTTARRLTTQAGAAYEALQTAQVEQLERELPAAPQGPAVQLLSVDGAMVPLVGGEWAEVKTLALGVVEEPIVNRRGEPEVHTTDLSYFSRLTDHETFGRLATVETHRRGTETAGVVCAVVDGAEWEQGFIALHRPDAVRILDWGHAIEYLAAAAQAAYGAGTVRAATWLAQQRHALTHDDPQTVLAALRALREEVAPGDGEAEAEASAPGVLNTQPGVPGEAAGADPVRHLRGAGLSTGQRQRRECQQAGGRGAAQGGRHALGAGARQSVGGAAHRGVQ